MFTRTLLAAVLLSVPGACSEGASGGWTVGDFVLDLDPHGRLRVIHLDADRFLFEAPDDRPWFQVGEAELEAHEHQGSFDLRETVHRLCEELTVTDADFAGGALTLRAEFTDCDGADASVRFWSERPGHLSFAITPDEDRWDLIVLNDAIRPDERVYGLGEQAPHHTLDLRGRAIPVISQEGGVGRGHWPITPAVNAFSSGSGGSEESTYYAAPHYLTSRNRSMFLENTEVSVFDFTGDRTTSVWLHAGEMRGRILHGESPLELIERFTEYAGRMPALPEWANEGAIVALARPLDQSLAIVDDLIAHDAAIAGVWNQTWSGVSTTYIGEQVLWNWVQNPTHHPGWGAWSDALADRGARTLCYVNSMFRPLPDDAGDVPRDLYSEGLAGGYFVRDHHGDVLMLPVTAFDVALLDLTNEDARRWMKDILVEEMIGNANCSGWMADFAEALPFEAVMHDGRTGAEFHNEYPVEWARLNREAVEEAGLLGDVLVFNRSGFTTTPRHSMLLWQGDQLTTWDRYDGMKSAVHGLISGGFSGIALNHSDIGGYTSLSYAGLGYTREAEQLKRWTELSAFTAAMRTHEGNQPTANAQVYSDDAAMAHFARMTRVYRALADYRSELFADATGRGWPVVRHLAMHHPDVDAAWEQDLQFLLGPDVLVAPVVEKGHDDRTAWLPPGLWVHLWSGDVVGHEVEADTVTVAAPLGEPAVFVRPERYPEIVAALQAEGIAVGGPGAGAGPTIACGETVTGDTTTNTAWWDAYECNVGNYEAPEAAFTWIAPGDVDATFALVDPVPMEVNHDVVVLGPDGCVTWGANSATFEAVAGTEYRLVVDGYDDDAGAFAARLTCSAASAP